MASVGLIVIMMAATLVLTFQSFRMAILIAVVAALSLGLGTLSLFCFGYPFDYGWGTKLNLGTPAETIDISHHNFCGWSQSQGEVGCEAEFPASQLDIIPPLSDCS